MFGPGSSDAARVSAGVEALIRIAATWNFLWPTPVNEVRIWGPLASSPHFLYMPSFTRSGWRLNGGSRASTYRWGHCREEQRLIREVAPSPSVFSFGYSIGLSPCIFCI